MVGLKPVPLVLHFSPTFFVDPAPVAMRLFRCGLLLLLMTLPASAQVPDSLSGQARLSLITVYPGQAIYSAFGHTAFRVYDPVQQIDWLFNYGTFDFRDPLFLPKFVYGQLDYFLSVSDYPANLAFYRDQEQRPVVEQVLNLEAAQRQAVWQFLTRNALPEHRAYRYDFLFDNCATRPRDVLEQTLGVQWPDAAAERAPFRALIQGYLADRPWLSTGIDLVLGLPTDRAATYREAMFLPVVLQEAVASARLPEGQGGGALVARTDTVYWAAPYRFPQAAGFRWDVLLLTGLLGVGVGWAVADQRRRRFRARWLDVLLLGGAGLAGLVLLFMWLGTHHGVTAQNLNLLWAWPTHLGVAVALGRGRRGPLLQVYLGLACGVTVLALAGSLVLPQPVPTALVPVLMLLAVRAGWLVWALRR